MNPRETNHKEQKGKQVPGTAYITTHGKPFSGGKRCQRKKVSGTISVPFAMHKRFRHLGSGPFISSFQRLHAALTFGAAAGTVAGNSLPVRAL